MRKPFILYIWELLCKLGFKVPKHIILEYAKYLYENSSNFGLCYCIGRAISCLTHGQRAYIPSEYFSMFNPVFCEADSVKERYEMPPYNTYWWNRHAIKPRLKALDKLIKYYKQNPKAK